jgi:hypothetical protein
MRPIEIALVNNTNKPSVEERIGQAVSAFNIQVSKHLRRCWTHVPEAIVRELKPDPRAREGFDPDQHTPPGVWPVILTDGLPGGVGGFHHTQHHQPYAEVAVTDDSGEWTIAASHEILEMLVDPSGHKLVAAPAISCTGRKINDTPGEVEYLLEICDPCEAKTFAYKVENTWVSDFVTPAYFACRPGSDTHYSFRHNIGAPRRILPGGYITWFHPQSRNFQQILWLEKNQDMIFNDRIDRGASAGDANLRAFIDRTTRDSHQIHRFGGQVRRLRDPQMLPPGDDGIGFGKLDRDHWVTYHKDGVIERAIYDDKSKTLQSSCMEIVRAHEPIYRPKDPTGQTCHKVTNKSCYPTTPTPIIPFDKDLIDPANRQMSG